MANGRSLTPSEKELLLSEFSALRTDLIRDFMRERISPLSGRKEQLVSRVVDALEGESEITWESVIRYLDQVEPYNKQHVILLKSSEGVGEEWTSDDPWTTALGEAGPESIWQQRLPVAAPEAMQLASATLADGVIEIYAIVKRTYPIRRTDLEREDLVPGANFETRVYETVSVRSWVRLLWTPGQDEASLHIRQLPSERLYRDTRDEFWQLLEPWFPIEIFEPLSLDKAVGALDELEENGQPEARVQAVEYRSRGGLRSAIRSSTAAQAVHGETEAIDGALTTLRETGRGAGGNFYFLPQPAGPVGNPLDREVHVTLVIKENRINFPRPVEARELEHVLRRIRVLAS